MKKAKKVVALALCAVMLVVGSVAGTMAYLQSTTQVVNNTFTVGKVAITLDEAVVNAYGEDQGTRTTTGNEYKLIPGHLYVKDPTVYVTDDSEESYLFVEVVNGLEAIEAEGTTTIEAQMSANWTPVTGNVYVYNETVNAGDEITVFENFTLADDADVSDYGEATITIQAYAVQADGFENEEAVDIWDAAFGN